jgi:hypothetical protein
MDKDVEKNASGWEIGRQEKKNLSFIVGSRAYMFQKICGYREENNKNTKKTKKDQIIVTTCFR